MPSRRPDTQATQVAHLFHLNCHQVHAVYVRLNGGELVYGWAQGPAGRAQHVWVETDGQVIDLFGWTTHERMGIRQIDRQQVQDTIEYLRDTYSPEEYAPVFTPTGRQ